MDHRYVAQGCAPYFEALLRTTNDKRTNTRRMILIENPRDLAVCFANSVTVESQASWIAKKGKTSLFKALQRMIPEIAQPEDGRHRLKGKISLAEFNKLVQLKCGFVCARTRRQTVSRVAGNWLFNNRRWLDPRRKADRIILHQNYINLCSKFPPFQQCCSWIEFSRCISNVCDSTMRGLSNMHIDVSHSESSPGEPSSATDDDYSSDAASPSTFHHTARPAMFGFAAVAASAARLSSWPTHSVALLLPPPPQTVPTVRVHCNHCTTAASILAPLAASTACASCSLLPIASDPPAAASAASTAPNTPSWSGTPWLDTSSARPLNAGELLDESLHAHWAMIPTLRMDAGDLEQFGRSASF